MVWERSDVAFFFPTGDCALRSEMAGCLKRAFFGESDRYLIECRALALPMLCHSKGEGEDCKLVIILACRQMWSIV